MREGRIQKPEDVDAAVVEGASARVRPLVMTVATTVLGLLPLLWEAGVGADVSARTAAPVVGGLWSCMLLTLLVLPRRTMWRRHQVRASLTLLVPHGAAAEPGVPHDATEARGTDLRHWCIGARSRAGRTVRGLVRIERHRHRVGRGAAHAFGMWDKHQLERQSHIAVSRWVAGLCWTCWLLLAALVVLLIVRS